MLQPASSAYFSNDMHSQLPLELETLRFERTLVANEHGAALAVFSKTDKLYLKSVFSSQKRLAKSIAASLYSR
jgi:hypothetical protein